MVNKTIAFETGGLAGWRATHLFIADNGLVPSACGADPAGNFFTAMDSFLGGHFPRGHALRRAYFAPTPCYPSSGMPGYMSYYASDVGTLNIRIKQQFNMGNQFVVYMGHAGTVNWGHENFFNLTSVAGLTNGNLTPIMLPMTCLDGYYHDPTFDSLSEALVKKSGGGAVASYAPTGLEVQQGHDQLLQGFYASLFEYNNPNLGQAVLQAKISSTGFPSLQDTFMLLGDPALRIVVAPHAEQVYLPVTRRP
jgi:hypothetical protein